MTNKLSTAAALLAATKTAAAAEMERDPIPAAIIEMATTREGKPLTKRDATALEARFPGLRCHLSKRSYGTVIEWWAYVHTDRDGTPQLAPSTMGNEWSQAALELHRQGVPTHNNASSVVITRATNGARWESVEWIRRENARYYSARDERNAERDRTLATIDRDPMRTHVTMASELVESIKLQLAKLDKIVATLPAETRCAIVESLAAPMRDADTDSILWDVRYSVK